MRIRIESEAFRAAEAAGLDNDNCIKYHYYVEKRKRINRTGRAAFKDSTKDKVYSAEFAFQRRYGKENFKKFNSYDTARAYLKRVIKSKLWQQLAQGRYVELIEKKNMGGRSRTAGVSWGSRIQLCPNYGMNEYVLLHELAHSSGNMHHDISFRKDLLRLVSRFIGREAAKILKEEFKNAGLKMSRKASILDPVEWNRRQERLVILRSKKNA